MTARNVKAMTTKYSDLDVDKFESTVPEENERSKGQLIGYINYDDNRLVNIQTPQLENRAGLPKRDDKYFITDRDLANNFRVIPDESIPEEKEYVDKMTEIDVKFGSAKYKKYLFGKKAKKYTYQPIVRTRTIGDEDEGDVVHETYMKYKLDMGWPDDVVKTSVYVLGDDGREKVDVETVDDFSGYVTYKSKMRLIVRPVKLWAHPSTKKDPMYGLVFKIIKVEAEPGDNSGSLYKTYHENDAFLDSDDDEDVDVEDSDEDTDSDEDSDEPVVIKKNRKGKKAHA